MATQTGTKKRPRRKLTPEQEVVRLRSELTRLRAEIKAMKAREAARAEDGPAVTIPVLPPADPDGNYPAAEALRVILAEEIIRRRAAAGWSQKELARRAGVRQETVCRLETGKHAATVTTVDKLDRALRGAGV